MALAIPRSLRAGGTLLLLLALVGCASRPVPIGSAEPGPPGASPPLADADECEAFARAEVATLKQPSAAVAFLDMFGGGVIAAAGIPMLCGPCLVMAPLGILGSPFAAASVAKENRRAREAAHASALRQCREPATLEATLGPDHPDVARSLQTFAARQAALGQLDQAETLHRRALAIWERGLPDSHPEMVVSLESLEGLLRRTGHLDEADALARRAKTIREALRIPAEDLLPKVPTYSSRTGIVVAEPCSPEGVDRQAIPDLAHRVSDEASPSRNHWIGRVQNDQGSLVQLAERWRIPRGPPEKVAT